jgi:hypothetical protein
VVLVVAEVAALLAHELLVHHAVGYEPLLVILAHLWGSSLLSLRIVLGLLDYLRPRSWDLSVVVLHILLLDEALGGGFQGALHLGLQLLVKDIAVHMRRHVHRVEHLPCGRILWVEISVGIISFEQSLTPASVRPAFTQILLLHPIQIY